MANLWETNSDKSWHSALSKYESVIGKQEVARLPELDDWYRNELSAAIARRAQPHVTHAELVKLTEWKMARGVWRAPNLVLVKSNDASAVVATSRDALSQIPHPTKPISLLATLSGVGPATASAVTAIAAPELYPFFDELVAAQLPSLGKVAWTLGYYAKYAAALRAKAPLVGANWTAVMIERALWANVGGKTGATID